uniref:Uncharacterized protein n=1 Tax=Arundo donax TaxID=35708 RepID=A0A0A9FQW7_ARUDO
MPMTASQCSTFHTMEFVFSSFPCLQLS